MVLIFYYKLFLDIIIFIILTFFITRFIFIQIKHPLAIGLILLIQTFLTSSLTGLYVKTFRFSYVLFLIFIGGILILFIYVTSLSSNEIFSISFKLSFIVIIIIIIFIIFSFLIDKSVIENFINNNEINLFFNNSLIPENLIELNKIYNFPTNLITLILINYLFLTLLVAVKITKKNYGPLRPIN
ncbi:NADH-ubiquinone oxidoreductase chain 6-like [Ochlerotatus camptorhynchus]|uniref:NADH-ubiquinone oxidoreductase chain 6-like n=1 Tax=Ochlerotatus camptorhynchus TaxID=644619 RepID=UPI0031D78199